MILEAWYKSNKWLHFSDEELPETGCKRSENEFSSDEGYGFTVMIEMKGCFIMYSLHKFNDTRIVTSKQDTNIGILSFQLSGHMNVHEKNFEPYRNFENENHISFFSTKRDLSIEVPPSFENFRVYISPNYLLQMLSMFHGRFSKYHEMVNASEPFSFFDMPLPITPKMKMVIHEIVTHSISDTILSNVFYRTKIIELFGYQIEQASFHLHQKTETFLTSADKEKISQARELMINNVSESMPLSKVSRLVALNEFKLKKGFKEIYGKSPHNYLISFRINESMELLMNENLTIDAVAQMVGYSDMAHFSRAFKKEKGIPPGKYKKWVRDKMPK
jgi:AraC-like DNA-binding protein